MFYRSGIVAVTLLLSIAWSPLVHAGGGNDDIFLALRDAARQDKTDLAAELADSLKDYDIPSYVDYYRLKPRLASATSKEVDAYLSRYAGSAIADRLRNDWLLLLGQQGKWEAFDHHYPLFALKDDLQLKCYALSSALAKGKNVADAARALLTNTKKYGEGCLALIASLAEKRQFGDDDIWAQMRLMAESGRGAQAENLATMLGLPEKRIARAIDLPLLTLARGVENDRTGHETFIIALGRLARKDHEKAAAFVLKNVVGKLKRKEQEQAWAQIALSASRNLAPEALEYWRKAGTAPLSTDGHEWKVRTALRAGDWKMVGDAIHAMPSALRSDAAWVYWLGRAMVHEGRNDEAERLYRSISDTHQFYGQLALEELGQKITVPAAISPVTPAEIAPMAKNPGFARALRFFDMGLRFEGVREWNWELRHMNEREHLAAAEYARERQVLDRMVNTSDRTRTEFDFSQRFPAPHRDLMQAQTQALGLDMAWAYGLIRQESRFVMNAQSPVGASGLMQLMPRTAKWVARKIGLEGFSQSDVTNPQTNIKLGTSYLKMVLGDLDGSQAMASAAYNAGPKRPRAWRAKLTHTVEGAIFAETIPFSETRTYVKNVLSNACYYAAIFENRPQSLKARLGQVTPKDYTATTLP